MSLTEFLEELDVNATYGVQIVPDSRSDIPEIVAAAEEHGLEASDVAGMVVIE